MAEWQSTSKLAPTTDGNIDICVARCSTEIGQFFLNFSFVEKKGGVIEMPAIFGDYEAWRNLGYYDYYVNGSLIHKGNYFPLFHFGDIKVGIKMELHNDNGNDAWFFIIDTYKENEIELAERMSYFYPEIDYDYFENGLAYITICYAYVNNENHDDGLYVGRWWQRVSENDPYFPHTMETLLYNNGDINGPLAGFTHGASNFAQLSYGGKKILYEELEDSLSSSGTSSGRGDYSLYSDDIGIPTLPNISALDSGFVSIYKPTLEEIKQLSGYLWGEDILSQLGKIWADPLELIISLGIIPFNPEVGSRDIIYLGALNSGVRMNRVTSQYYQLDCGTVKVNELFGSALDYNPYCNVSIFLPFVGVVPLNIDEIMDMSIQVVYNIDLLSGAFTCVIKSTNNLLNSVLYHFSGNCLTPIPLTSNTHSGLYSSILNIAGATIGGAISGGSGGAVGGALSTTAKETLTSKTSVSRSGSISGNAGLLDNMKPYFIIERAIQSLPYNYKHFNGYPSNIKYKLNQLSGFTKIESVISNTLTCPMSEQNEIINLLKTGVYL